MESKELNRDYFMKMRAHDFYSRVEHLGTYEINTLLHGKCFVRFLFTR